VTTAARVRQVTAALDRMHDATADELLECLASELRAVVPHDSAGWFGVDPVTMLAAAPSRVEGLDASLCNTFWHLEFHEQDTALFSDLARGDGATALRLALDDRPTRSIRYREFLQPQGFSDELRAVFRSGGSTWGFVGLYRVGGAFTEDDVAVMRGVSTAIGTALREHVRDANPWLGAPTAPGLIVVDSSGRAITANAEAHQWLRELWPHTEEPSPGRIDVFDRRDVDLQVPTPLYALVARARAFADGRERAPARLRLRDRRGRWLVFHASALQGADASDTGSVALVIEAAKSAEIAPVVIEAYGLTKREREVLGAMARGATTAEIAAELFLSPHTVRDYVKAVFEKFSVSSRAELVARLYSEHYADPLHETMVHID
jgi:DNA-binding CsgD family transcriptional regulator